MKVLVVDSVNTERSHSSFNATILQAICNVKHISSVGVIFGKTHSNLKSIRTILDNKKISNIVQLPKSQMKFDILFFFRTIRGIYKNVETNKPDVIIFLAADNLFIPIIAYCLKILSRKKVFIILHNNIENSKQSSIKKIIWKLVLRRKLVGIVLSEHMKELAKKTFGEGLRVKVLKHPTYAHLINSTIRLKKEYDFLLLGRHSDFFHDNEFSKIFFNACSTYNNNVSIMAKENIIERDYPNINKLNYKFPLSEDLYWKKLTSAKFLLIPSAAETRSTASGVHLDAMTVGTPIIAPNIGIFNENVPSLSKFLLYDKENIADIIYKSLDMNKSLYSKISNEIAQKSNEVNLERTSKRIEHLFKDI